MGKTSLRIRWDVCGHLARDLPEIFFFKNNANVMFNTSNYVPNHPGSLREVWAVTGG